MNLQLLIVRLSLLVINKTNLILRKTLGHQNKILKTKLNDFNWYTIMSKIKVGIIGTGFGSKVHLPAFTDHTDFEPVVICGRNSEKGTKIAQDYNINFTTDWKGVVKDPNIDLIAITTPPYFHYEMAKESFKHNKSILLEKPTTNTAKEAQKLFRMADEQNLIGLMAHEFRWEPSRQVVKKLLDEGFIGIPKEVSFYYHQNFASSSEKPPYGWLFDAKYDGGLLGASASHYVDLARYLIGSELTDVMGKVFTRVPLRKDREGNMQKVTADDGYFIQGTFENHATLLVNYSSTNTHSLPAKLIFSGDEGTIYIEGSDVFGAKKGEEFSKIQIKKEFELDTTLQEKDVRIPPFLKLLDQLSRSLKEKTSLTPSFYDGWRNQQVLDAVRQSQYLGSKISITNYS